MVQNEIGIAFHRFLKLQLFLCGKKHKIIIRKRITKGSPKTPQIQGNKNATSENI